MSINVQRHQRHYIKIRDVVCRQKLSWQMIVISNACAFPPIPLMHTVNRELADNWVMVTKVLMYW